MNMIIIMIIYHIFLTWDMRSASVVDIWNCKTITEVYYETIDSIHYDPALFDSLVS